MSKFTCLTVDSIRLMADAACLPEPSKEVALAISEDTALRLRQIICRAAKFMRHANRTKLTCSDINKALKWSDCQPVFGYECKSNQRIRYSYLPEAQVFRYEDEIVDLESLYGEKKGGRELLCDDMQREALPSIQIKELVSEGDG